jgi:hypothetical protein
VTISDHRPDLPAAPAPVVHYPVPVREPIALLSGNLLFPRAADGGDEDRILAHDYAGKHATCDGVVKCRRTTARGTLVLFCAACGLRLSFTTEIVGTIPETFGDLRALSNKYGMGIL